MIDFEVVPKDERPATGAKYDRVMEALLAGRTVFIPTENLKRKNIVSALSYAAKVRGMKIATRERWRGGKRGIYVWVKDDVG